MREILLAEDNPADVYLVRMALREHGVDCPMRVASNGKDVLQIIASAESTTNMQHLALIILDLNLPLHDGIEILDRLRGQPELVQIPVVILTSSDSPRDRKLANELGATRYLRKPSSLDQFLSLGAIFKDLLGPAGQKSEAL